MGRPVKTHTINGKKCYITIKEIDGLAINPSRENGELLVNCDLNTKKGIITLFHEFFHLSSWDRKKDTVERESKELGTLVWRLGYRIKK